MNKEKVRLLLEIVKETPNVDVEKLMSLVDDKESSHHDVSEESDEDEDDDDDDDDGSDDNFFDEFVNSLKMEDVVNLLTEQVYNKYRSFCISNGGTPLNQKWMTRKLKKSMGLETGKRIIDGKEKAIFHQRGILPPMETKRIWTMSENQQVIDLLREFDFSVKDVPMNRVKGLAKVMGRKVTAIKTRMYNISAIPFVR